VKASVENNLVDDNVDDNSEAFKRVIDSRCDGTGLGDRGAPPFADLSQYHEPGYDAGGSRIAMLLWWLVQSIAFPLTMHMAHGIRCQLLRLFGAKVGPHVRIRPTARFTYPWNIEIGDYSWIGDDAVLYSLAPIKIGRHCVISQKNYLCTGSHDMSDPRFGLVTGEVVVEDGVWIATDCFVGPNVRIGANAVIGVRSTVLDSMPPGQICVGTPCKPVKPRLMNKLMIQPKL
jgi:putative colanic acid biosynthesis acetyltransferase WcaF